MPTVAASCCDIQNKKKDLLNNSTLDRPAHTTMSAPDVITGCAVDAPVLQKAPPNGIVWHLGSSPLSSASSSAVALNTATGSSAVALNTATGSSDVALNSAGSSLRVSSTDTQLPVMTLGSSVRVLIESMPIQTRRLLRQVLTMAPVLTNGPKKPSTPAQTYQLYTKVDVSWSTAPESPKACLAKPMPFKRKIASTIQNNSSSSSSSSSEAGGADKASASQQTLAFLPRAFVIASLPIYTGHQLWRTCASPFNNKNADSDSRVLSNGFSVFSGTLHDYQEAACRHVLDKLQNDRFHGGLLTAGCGVGKTTMALHIAYELKVRTAILVHTNVLLSQWQEKIKQYLPHASVGVLQGKLRPKPDDDFCVCMLPTTAKLDLSDANTVTGAYGLLIADECHHICCRTFSQALARFKTPYMLGLTATPDRTDQLGYAIEWLIGPVLYKITRDTPRVQVLMCRYVNPRFRHATFKWDSEKMDYTKTLTWIVSDKWRTRRFAELMHALAGGERRTILALSNRVCKLENLNILLPRAGLLIGKKSNAQRELAKLQRVVLASACLADEGLDVPGFDTLAQGTPCRCKKDEPNGKLEQRLGRILRGKSDDVPLVVDFYDGYKMFAGMAQARRRWYASKGYGFRKSIACLRPTMPGDVSLSSGPLSEEEEAKLKEEIASQFPPISPYSATTWDECNTPLPDYDDPVVIATLQASGWRRKPAGQRACSAPKSTKEPEEREQAKQPAYDYVGCFDHMLNDAVAP